MKSTLKVFLISHELSTVSLNFMELSKPKTVIMIDTMLRLDDRYKLSCSMEDEDCRDAQLEAGLVHGPPALVTTITTATTLSAEQLHSLQIKMVKFHFIMHQHNYETYHYF